MTKEGAYQFSEPKFQGELCKHYWLPMKTVEILEGYSGKKKVKIVEKVYCAHCLVAGVIR